MGPIGFDRRQFLRGTAGLGALASMSAMLGAACTRTPPPAGPTMEVFSSRQAAALAALVEAVLPTTPGLPGGLEVGVLPSIDRALKPEAAAIKSRLGDALLFLEWSPQFSRHFKPFTALPAKDRLVWFRGFGTSRWIVPRAVHQGLKGLITFHWADVPAVWPALGYDGPWVGRPAEPAAPMPAREFGR